MGYVLCTPGLLFRNYQFSSCLDLPSQYLLSTYLTWSNCTHLQPTSLRARLSAKHHETQHNPETQLPSHIKSPSALIMRWMKLEPIIQSDINQKEKHQYSILMHIYGI